MKYQTAIEQEFKAGDKVIVHYNLAPFKPTPIQKNYSFHIGKITEIRTNYLCFVTQENKRESKIWSRINRLERIDNI